MKWHAWSKWPLLGVAVTAVVLAAPSDHTHSVDGQKDVESTAPGNVQQVARATQQQPAVTQEKPANQADQHMNRVELERLKRENPDVAAAEKTEVANAFNVVSWYEPPPPPPPAPVVAPEPIVPTAPPMPFTYFGRYENPPSRIVMLARNEQIYTVSEGDVIDETYRVEHITDGSVALVYLPLGTIQSISMRAK
ncbi:MAG: hypothetical protein WC208_11085 [Gallionella sp.]|jgi:hypothetical protein